MTTWITGLASPDGRRDGYGFSGLVEGTEKQARDHVGERFGLAEGEHEGFILVNPFAERSISILEGEASEAGDFVQVAICQAAIYPWIDWQVLDCIGDDDKRRIKAMTQAEAWEECARVIWEAWAEAEEVGA